MEESYTDTSVISTPSIDDRVWHLEVSNNERWYCECCGGRRNGAVSHITSTGEEICYLWVCDNCAHLSGEVQLAAVWYLEKHGEPLYDIFGWVENKTKDAVTAIPWSNTKIAVSVGAISADGTPRCECCLGPAIGDMRALMCCGVSLGHVSLCGKCVRLQRLWGPETLVAAAFLAQRNGRPAPWLEHRLAHGIPKRGNVHG